MKLSSGRNWLMLKTPCNPRHHIRVAFKYRIHLEYFIQYKLLSRGNLLIFLSHLAFLPISLRLISLLVVHPGSPNNKKQFYDVIKYYVIKSFLMFTPSPQKIRTSSNGLINKDRIWCFKNVVVIIQRYTVRDRSKMTSRLLGCRRYRECDSISQDVIFEWSLISKYTGVVVEFVTLLHELEVL